MTHLFDPNGSIREYRRQRDRRETIRVCIFSLCYFCALAMLLCAVFITLSLLGG